MKKLLYLCIVLTLFACGGDDDSIDFIVTVDNITQQSAKISWNTPSEGNYIYRLIIDNEVEADGLQTNSYYFETPYVGRTFNGTVIATNQNGDETFSNFTFSLLESEFNPDCGGCFITLRTQTEIDNLPPYTSITELTISATNTGDDITDLTPLSNLASVSKLIIDRSTLINLNGLENLDDVGTLFILSNSNLNDISALTNTVNQIDSGLYFAVVNNPNLNNLTMFNINGNTRFEIRDSPEIALPTFAQDCSNCSVEFRNVNLTNLDGFENTINLKKLALINTYNLTDLSALNNLEHLEVLNLWNLDFLTDFSGFTNLTTLEELEITDLNSITSLDGFNSLTNSPSDIDRARVFIKTNTLLSDFCALTTFMQNTIIYDEYIEPVGLFPEFGIEGNAYNPSEDQIESETECSQ